MFAQPVQVNITSNDRFEQMQALLGHYDLRLYWEKAYIDVGRGSSSAALRLANLPAIADGCVGTVGQWCDFASDCSLHGGSEHQNDEAVNVVFAGIPAFKATAQRAGIASLLPKQGEPFAIGNAVVISSDCKVMSGAKIGDGAVLAAGAIAAGQLEPFAIHGGVPAKKLRDRKIDRAAMEQVRWWDFDTAYIGDNLARLQELAVDTQTQHVYRKPTPRMVLRLGPQKVEFIGVMDAPGGVIPEKVREYVGQINAPGQKTWIANIWD